MESIWSRDCHMEKRDPLTRSIETEIAVVGAGMAGVLIAHALQRDGRQVVVLEADRTGSGQTRNTTAKVTSQHGLIYRKLIRTFGWAKAATTPRRTRRPSRPTGTSSRWKASTAAGRRSAPMSTGMTGTGSGPRRRRLPPWGSRPPIPRTCPVPSRRWGR